MLLMFLYQSQWYIYENIKNALNRLCECKRLYKSNLNKFGVELVILNLLKWFVTAFKSLTAVYKLGLETVCTVIQDW